MTLLLDWEGAYPSLRPYPPTLVMAETRRVTKLVPDSPTWTKLEAAKLSHLVANRFRCEIPKLSASPGLAIFLVARDQEHRLTFYTPGYVVTTIYPEGCYNSAASASAPIRLRSKSFSAGCSLETDFRTLERRKDQDGEEVFVVKMEKLPKGPVDQCDLYTFYSQVASVDEAISGGFLRSTEEAQRRILVDAIRQEYDLLESAKVQSEYFQATFTDARFAERTKPRCDRVQAWAEMQLQQ